jgi:hypothetical protein
MKKYMLLTLRKEVEALLTVVVDTDLEGEQLTTGLFTPEESKDAEFPWDAFLMRYFGEEEATNYQLESGTRCRSWSSWRPRKERRTTELNGKIIANAVKQAHLPE